MPVSRREFFKASAGMAGTAIGGLVGLGVDLTPKVAHAEEIRIKDAKVYPSVCPYCAVGCGTLVHTVGGQIVGGVGPRTPAVVVALASVILILYPIWKNCACSSYTSPAENL